MSDPIVFSKPFETANELPNLAAVLASDHVHGDGQFTESATQRLKEITGAQHALLTTSGTHALELAALLLDIGPGDEVIVPSFTFPSAATAVATRSATCVFVDIDPDTGNVDPERVAEAVTDKTVAISVVHYAGVAAELEPLQAIAREHQIGLIEDTAHALGGTWRGRQLGTIGNFGALSFHDTKNIHCGEGGALLIGDANHMIRAEMIREKGTNRAQFLRGLVDKYTWYDIGSSYLPSELNAAVLDSQLAEFDGIQHRRHAVWNRYHCELADWAARSEFRLMLIPPEREHTAHMYYLLAPTGQRRDQLIEHLRERGIAAPFHYVPLDTSTAGLKYGRTPRPCSVSADFSSRLIRLPLWAGLTPERVSRVIDAVTAF